MGQRIFPIIIQEGEDGKYIASCPAIEGCFSQGNTIPEAMTNIREAIALCLEDMANRGEQIPDAPATFLTEITV